MANNHLIVDDQKIDELVREIEEENTNHFKDQFGVNLESRYFM